MIPFQIGQVRIGRFEIAQGDGGVIGLENQKLVWPGGEVVELKFVIEKIESTVPRVWVVWETGQRDSWSGAGYDELARGTQIL